MNKNPTISIIMPVYNAGRYLPETIRGILDQTFGDFELICVDDKSTDNSLQVLRDFAAEDRRVKVIALEKNVGPANARTKGLLASTGEFVMFSDDDDLFHPNACERALAAIREHQCDVVHFNFRMLKPDGKLQDPVRFMFPRPGRREGETLVKVFFGDKDLQKQIDHILWDKIYRGDMCRRGAAAMSENIPNCGPDDYYTFMCIVFFGRTYYGLPDERLYTHRDYFGYSTNTQRVLDGIKLIPVCQEFLKRQNALESHGDALTHITNRIYTNALESLLRQPHLTPEIMGYAARLWGSEILIDFFRYAGFFELTCTNNWFNLAPNLLREVEDLRRKLDAPRTPQTPQG